MEVLQSTETWVHRGGLAWLDRGRKLVYAEPKALGTRVLSRDRHASEFGELMSLERIPHDLMSLGAV